MSLNNPLFVPLELNAFAVNQNTLENKGANIQRWQYAYAFLNSYNTPMPKPFTGQNTFTTTGMAVHWELPHILRQGWQGDCGGMQFPLVPNRWLVVRYSGPPSDRSAVAWLVQSDALGNSTPITGGSPYIDPGADTMQPTWVGQVVGLSNWSEPNPPKLFLTAVAPGNNMFAAFQPFCQSVFSIFDPLTGVADQDTLSYMVAGWYSDPAKDIVGEWQSDGSSFQAFLDRAGWKLAEPSSDDSTIGIYSGLSWGIQWDLNGPAQNNTPPPGDVQVSMGNTTTDALTALIAAQAQGNQEIDPELLEALQYGLLPAYDQPDAQFELQQQIHQSWFGSGTGGYQWEIVNAPVDSSTGDPPPLPSPEELQYESQWLSALNLQQQAFDQAVLNLVDLQWNLYQTWWKYGFAQSNGMTSPYPQGTTQAQFQQALDANDPTSLISRVHAQQQTVATFAATIPTGSTQQELQSAILTYATDKNLPSTRELKQTALRPFQSAYDPTLLMHGLRADDLLAPIKPLTCRFLSQLVTGFTWSGGTILLSQVASVVPTPPNMSVLPAQVVNLLQEFFLLDPTNATMIAQAALGSSEPQTIAAVAAGMQNTAGDIGIAPDISLKQWKQPWAPLVLLWDVVWYPIPHDNGTTPLWSFDGNEYTWSGTGFDSNAPTWEYQGAIFLTPQASFNFRAQIEKFILENPDVPGIEKLYEFIDQIDGWDFLSQSLVGLTQMMALRDPAPNLSPAFNAQTYFSDQTFNSLIGSSANYVPQPGIPQPPPFESWPPSGFQNWRAGQFLIRRLFVIDRFGQSCEVVTSTTQTGFTPILAPSLVPQVPVLQQQPERLIQLPPRLLQPGRLNFDYVSCANDNQVLGIDPAVNPICGWLLHNYLDESIVAYDNAGSALGAVWIITNSRNEQEVHWQAAPESPYLTIADLLNNPDLAHLGQMLGEIQTLGPSAFQSLILTVDEAVWNIGGGETTGDFGLTLLAGRPVALLRVRLMFHTAGTAISDPSWRFTFAPQTNPASTWQYPIRLGEAGQQQDGLIGYFKGSDYTTLNAPNPPQGNPDPEYVVPVGTGAELTLPFDSATPAYLTLLTDPRAVIHATTGILPVVTIAVPQHFVDAAFANMQVSFTIGPLLSDLVVPQDPGPNDLPALVLPRPSLKNGTWSWRQFDGTAWAPYDVAQSVQTAQMSNVNPILREGLLQLSKALGSSSLSSAKRPKQ
jgi:hypothetical protein